MKGIKTGKIRLAPPKRLALVSTNDITFVRHRRNPNPVSITRYIYVDGSRYKGADLRELRRRKGVGNVRKIKGD